MGPSSQLLLLSGSHGILVDYIVALSSVALAYVLALKGMRRRSTDGGEDIRGLVTAVTKRRWLLGYEVSLRVISEGRYVPAEFRTSSYIDLEVGDEALMRGHWEGKVFKVTRLVNVSTGREYSR